MKVKSKGEVTRQTIVDESLQLFSVKGYYNTSIKDVLAATGLTKGGLYGHFSITWPTDALDLDAGSYEIEGSISFNGSVQTANRYYWEDDSDYDAKTMAIKVREEF